VSTAWVVLSLLGPPVVAALAGWIFSSRDPGPAAVIACNTLMPGAGLAAAGRPMIEVVLGVLFSQASLFIAGGVDNAGFLIPSMVVGGVWASLHTRFSPIELAAAGSTIDPQLARASGPAGSSGDAAPATAISTRRPSEGSTPELEESGYAVAVRCTECGADIEVPVLARMAHCAFCGSKHLVVGHDETLYVTIPERLATVDDLREAVLDHYRYQHYLKLYRSSVAPLERSATESSPSGVLVTRPEVDAASAAAERAVAKKADIYRAKLAAKLEIGTTLRFLAPYRHGMGTLYQAAFGRSRSDQEKKLRFAIGMVEAAVTATSSMDIPKMGKLSYLRALVPAAQCSPETRSLPLEVAEDALERAYGNLDHKQLMRDLQVIRLGVNFSQEVQAVVWRPWWIAEVRGPGIHETLLVESAGGSVAGTAPYLNPETLVDLPEEARRPGAGLRFVPMECPTCGHEFTFDTDAVLHFCTNCHRVCGVDGEHKYEVDYVHQPEAPDGAHDLVPFWYFPLAIRTADGHTLTDLMHLKDGIDGTFDQIGEEAVMRRHGVLVPAFRVINPRLMALAFQRLFLHSLRRPPKITGQRFPLDLKPQPWSVSLEEPEARRMLPLYLANAFGRRDLARVNIHQVSAWLFEAVQQSPGKLAFVPVPKQITEPFRQYVGRYRSRAVRHASAETLSTS